MNEGDTVARNLDLFAAHTVWLVVLERLRGPTMFMVVQVIGCDEAAKGERALEGLDPLERTGSSTA